MTPHPAALRHGRRAHVAVAFAFALALAAASAAGCTSSTPPVRRSASVAPPVSPPSPGHGRQGRRTTPPASEPSPGSSRGGTTTPAPAPATSPPAEAAPQPCPTSALGIAPGISQAAAGSTYVTIVFTNIGAAACTLYGYPGVSLAGGSPVSQIGLAAKENPATPRQLVTLVPGAQASALLRIVDAQNFPRSRCGLVSAAYLQVYPPNQTTPAYVSYSVAACSKPVPLLTVDVVKPSSGG